MADKKKWASQLDGDELYKDRKKRYVADARWRKTATKRSNEDAPAILFDSEGQAAGEQGDIPEINYIRPAVQDAVGLMIQNIPRTGLSIAEEVDPSLPEQQRKIIEQNMMRSVKAKERLVHTQLRDNQLDDVRVNALVDAAVFGFGALHHAKRGIPDTYEQPEASRLSHKPMMEWTERDYRLYHRLAAEPFARHEDARNVYFQAGVRNFFSPQMRRATILNELHIDELREMYADSKYVEDPSDLRPTKPPYMVEVRPPEDDAGSNVGMITTYEREPHGRKKTIFRMGPGDAKEQVATVSINDHLMIKTVIGGGKLLERHIWDSQEAPMIIPVTPYYLLQSLQHPYGYSMVMAMKLVQQFLNSLMTVAYQQGRQSVAPQSFAMLLGKLGASDTIEEIHEKMLEGKPIAFEGNEIDDIRQAIQPLSHLSAGISSAMQGMIAMAQSQFKTLNATGVDRDALARAESGSAKRTHMQAATQGQTQTVYSTARSEENVHDYVAENIRVNHGERPFSASIVPEKGQGREAMQFNQPQRRFLPILDGRGQPVMNEFFRSPENPAGVAVDKIDFRENDMSVVTRAQSEGRGDLPLEWQARLVALSAMLQNQVIVPKTVRDLALPPEIAAIDDANRREQAEAAAAMRQQMARQMGAQFDPAKTEKAVAQAMASGAGSNAIPAMQGGAAQSEAQAAMGAGAPGGTGGSTGAGMAADQTLPGETTGPAV